MDVTGFAPKDLDLCELQGGDSSAGAMLGCHPVLQAVTKPEPRSWESRQEAAETCKVLFEAARAQRR